MYPNTWTHNFVCLARMLQEHVPTTDEKRLLRDALMGEKKIVFEKRSDPQYFHDKLLDEFPPLRHAGGYQLMRAKLRSPTQLDIIVPHPNKQYNVMDLRTDITSAKIYIVPIQNDLSLTPVLSRQVSSS